MGPQNSRVLKKGRSETFSENKKKRKDVVTLSVADNIYFNELLASCQDNDLLVFETLFLVKAKLFLTNRKAESLDVVDNLLPESEELQQGSQLMEVQHSAGETKEDVDPDDSTEPDLYDPRHPPTQPRIIIEMLTSNVINNGLDNDSDSDLDAVDTTDFESIIGNFEGPFEPCDQSSVEMSTPAADEEDHEIDNQRTSLHSDSLDTDGDREEMIIDHQIDRDTPSHVVNIDALLQAFHHLAASYPGDWKISPGVTTDYYEWLFCSEWL